MARPCSYVGPGQLAALPCNCWLTAWTAETSEQRQMVVPLTSLSGRDSACRLIEFKCWDSKPACCLHDIFQHRKEGIFTQPFVSPFLLPLLLTVWFLSSLSLSFLRFPFLLPHLLTVWLLSSLSLSYPRFHPFCPLSIPLQTLFSLSLIIVTVIQQTMPPCFLTFGVPAELNCLC